MTAASQNLAQRIARVLEAWKVPATLADRAIEGPAFVRFTLDPGPGFDVRKMLNSAAALGARLGLPVPWMGVEDGVVILEVSRGEDREVVSFSRVREALPPPDPARDRVEVPLGIDVLGRLQCLDLTSPESPHILVAGAHVSGKTEWLRTAIAALILTNTPETLRLVLIDPQRSAFEGLEGSPYLLHPQAVLHPPDGSVVAQLDLLIETMEERYRRFHTSDSEDLSEWHSQGHEPLPHIVCVMDEFEPLMAEPGGRESMEERVSRLGARARGAGIHLILSTGHPGARTITGRLQANFPARVCLKTTSWQESMIALKHRGAERLLGRGDLFCSRGGRLFRLQGALLSADDQGLIFSNPPKNGERPVSDARI